MKSLLSIWHAFANELAGRCHTHVGRDYETVAARVEAEGLSFLTITLPEFGKALERALESGSVCSNSFPGFHRSKKGLPRFLAGFLEQIFDESGAVRPTTVLVTDCILAVRQLTGLFAKIELPCSTERTSRAVNAFVVADQETTAWDRLATHEDLSDLRRMARLLYADVLPKFAEMIRDEDLTPAHGPGAVSERIRGNAKWHFQTWPERLEQSFPFRSWGLPNSRWVTMPTEPVRYLSEDEEHPSRVILVPKTLKAPRVIAAEPLALQYIQQGLKTALTDLLEKDALVSPMIGFTDQGPNQDLAKLGSVTGDLATLDLSEASDRVSLKQACAVLGGSSWVEDAILATRSQRTQLPSGDVIPLGKFAAMGSALCFPVEAMVFLTAVFLGIERATRSIRGSDRMTRCDIAKYHGKVRVYGDDIIVPVDCVPSVLSTLSRYGWRVNESKSFWNGKFRESCGGDFYDGEWVTPIRLRRMIPQTLESSDEVMSLVSFRNQLYVGGHWKTMAYIDTLLKRTLRGRYPRVAPTSALLGGWTWTKPDISEHRLDKDTHAPQAKGYVAVPKIPTSHVEDHAALLKCLLTSNPDQLHLQRAGRPVAVDIKLRWKSVV